MIGDIIFGGVVLNDKSLSASIHQIRRSTLFRASTKTESELRRAEAMTAGELSVETAKRCSEQARFAIQNVPFYQEFYRDHGFQISSFDDPAAFTELPILEKTHVRENFDKFISTERTERNSVISRTGGSTGEPLKLLRDLRFPARALEWQLFSWWDVPQHGHFAEIRRQVKGVSTSKVREILWWPTRRFQIDAYSLTEESVEAFAQQWLKTPPSVVIGYVGAVLEVSRRLGQLGYDLPAPQAIATTAAPLHMGTREEISSLLGAPCYDHYRSAEIPWMAGECQEQDGLHILEPLRTVEIVGNDDRPASVGQTIASDLTNRVFPLIRYRLGDQSSVIEEACRCGRPFPRIRSVVGRTSDNLKLPSGVVIAAEGLTQLCEEHIESVRQFQIHQKSDKSVDVRLVLRPGAESQRVVQAISDKLDGLLKHEVPIQVDLVDSIAHVGGKISYISSDA